MNINTDSMTQVQDVQKRKSTTPDLKYSDQTERWTMNEAVQDFLDLDGSHGFNMYIAENDEGEDVVLLEVVDTDDATFYKGEGNVFIARRLADAIDHHSFALNPVDDMDGEFFILDEWEGTSYILENMNTISSDNPIDEEEETTEEVTDLSSENDEPTFDYGMDEDEEVELA